MPEPDQQYSMPPDAVQSLQDNLERGKPAMFAAYGLIGGMLVLGAAGFGIDRYLGTEPWCLLAGLLGGLGIGMYQLVRLRS